MSETRKIVEFKVVAEFVGDYYDLSDCQQLPVDWMFAGLDDRDDLDYVSIDLVSAVEEEL